MEELILNRYKPIETAGEGGFGKVVVAYDTRVNRRVAIKCIKLNSSIISNFVDEAGEHWQENVPGLTEARTAAMVHDSNIVTVYDFELQDDCAYIIMEYVEGMTLTQFLYQYGDELTLDMVTTIISGIVHAVTAGHSENVLHLDIKPDNILIDSKGKVKVTDFGLATLADEFGYGTADAGTIGYMPPEQMRQLGLDARCDEWSLACIIYEMLTGNNPFNSDTIPGSINKIYDSELALPSHFWDDLDEGIDDVLFKALQPEVDKRYNTVADFSEDLMPYLASEKAGKRQIAALFKNSANPEYEPKTVEKKKEYITSRSVMVTGRAFSSLSSVILSAIGFNLTPHFAPWMYLFLIAVAGLSAFLPSVGFSLSILILAIPIFLSGNYIVGSILLLATVLWCVFSGIKAVSNSNTTSCFPLFGIIGFAQIAPFISGMFCKPLYSAINTFYGFLLCSILGAGNLVGWNVSDISCPLTIFLKIELWIWGVSWVLSSLLVSFTFETKSSLIKVFGIAGGLVVLLFGICFSNFVSSGFVSWQPQGWEILPTVLAAIVSGIAAVLLPNRGSKLTPRDS